MKKMGLMLLLVVMLVVAGCGNATSDEKVYKIASDGSYAPMEYMDKDKLVGFDIDFLKAVMDEAGLKYTVTNVGWEAMLESVKQGTEYDAAISAVSITDERKQTYDFSVPYYESTNMILVNEKSSVASAKDLVGKKVAVQTATTADVLMSDIMGKTNADLKRFESNALALMELANGGVDAVVADITVVQDYMKNNPDMKLKGLVDKDSFGAEYYGMLYPKNGELKAKLDPAIKKVIENGTYAKIYKEWFGEEPNVSGLLQAK